jgi:hypothetical protein
VSKSSGGFPCDAATVPAQGLPRAAILGIRSETEAYVLGEARFRATPAVERHDRRLGLHVDASDIVKCVDRGRFKGFETASVRPAPA